ncbi:MAG: fumarylacetoacetate hydrolase family protein [Gammaproteobacteria bacterium]|nr:fumarylacetoacetate hydrolase family protein [Gammaproteobacteria bacterium]
MSSFVFTPTPRVSLPVRGSEQRFPVRRIYCVGRNYAAHTVEMGGDPDREVPFFFQKNPDDLLCDSADFPYPDRSNDVHHEIEMMVALQKGGKDIPAEFALEHVWGYGVALDMTRRDLQGKCKKNGRPWEVGKAFDHSAPASELVAASEINHPSSGDIWLKVNGEIRQLGNLNQMIWKTEEIIAHLSSLFTLAPGDLILSGTPSGVGAVVPGDIMEGHIDGVGNLQCNVV